MHTWKTRIAATLAVLMLTNCISPAAFAQNTEESPQSTQVSLLSDENNADFTIKNGVLTAYTGSEKNVVIPDTVTVIGDGSTPIFGSGVESVVIPASVTEIAENAFNGCTGLKSVTFAEDGQLTTIGDSAFYAANQLETLTIPEGVTSIGNHAFTATNKLQTITLPSTLTTVCGDAWFGNLFAFGSQNSAPANLMAVNIASGNEQYCSYDGVVYAADGKTLLYCPAAKQTIDWLAGVEKIAPDAFAKTTMEHIQLPDGLKAIQAYGFRGAQCTAVTVPGSVVSIGDSAFYNSSKLSQVVFADGIETIGNSAFSECCFRGDVVLTLPASLKSVGDSAFDCLTDMSSSATVKVLGKDTALGDAFVPNSTKLTLYGLEGSTAQAYAEKLGDHCNLTFQLLGGETEAAVESVTLP